MWSTLDVKEDDLTRGRMCWMSRPSLLTCFLSVSAHDKQITVECFRAGNKALSNFAEPHLVEQLPNSACKQHLNYIFWNSKVGWISKPASEAHEKPKVHLSAKALAQQGTRGRVRAEAARGHNVSHLNHSYCTVHVHALLSSILLALLNRPLLLLLQTQRGDVYQGYFMISGSLLSPTEGNLPSLIRKTLAHVTCEFTMISWDVPWTGEYNSHRLWALLSRCPREFKFNVVDVILILFRIEVKKLHTPQIIIEIITLTLCSGLYTPSAIGTVWSYRLLMYWRSLFT